jgi:hypothetical protein
MGNIVTSLVLIAAQVVSTLAAPLFVCTSAGGQRALDFGDLACACHHEAATAIAERHATDGRHTFSTGELLACGGHNQHSPHGDCHCHHQPLVEPAHPGAHATRWPAAGEQAAACLASQPPVGLEPGTIAEAARAAEVPGGAGPLGDWGSVCLRC